MKLWQKIFLGTLIIFIAVFDIGAFMLTSFAYDYSRERETEIAVREQSVILSSFTSSLLRAENFDPEISMNKTRLPEIMSSLSNYYQKQGVELALLLNSEIIYSDLIYVDKEWVEFSDSNSKIISETKIDDKRILVVSSQVSDYTELNFVYCRDISAIDEFCSDISEFFVMLNIIIIPVTCILIFLILKYITKPIALLNTMAAEIADGSYDKRVEIKRSDELGQLAESFNRMADSIEETMFSLKKSAEDKQQFIDDLAHEMKTPMTSVIGYSEYLKNANGSKENQIIALEHLSASMLRLKNLSEELMKLTLLREEITELKQIEVDRLLNALEVTMKPSLDTRNIKLLTEATLEYIFGDEVLLLSVLTNLVENAARASKSGDCVTVRAYESESAIIEVEDKGIGMEQEEIEKITAPFYRIDKSRSREFGGVGLGMSIVSRIAALHNARLEIKSEKGAGTVVRIIFTTL
ncbi:MAG: sensor histidine kinase [Acutalibacteraceae bacterium]